MRRVSGPLSLWTEEDDSAEPLTDEPGDLGEKLSRWYEIGGEDLDLADEPSPPKFTATQQILLVQLGDDWMIRIAGES